MNELDQINRSTESCSSGDSVVLIRGPMMLPVDQALAGSTLA
jgi:hypothetical protein